MLIAENISTGKLVSANLGQKSVRYRCPGCQHLVQLRHGAIRQPYFAHERFAHCETFSEGETGEHLLGKQQLAQWLSQQGNQVVLEQKLTALHQRPDLLINGKVAVEFQCSPIGLQRLSERVNGYRQHGLQQLWLLGAPYLPKQRLVLTKVGKFLRWQKRGEMCLLFWDTKRQLLLLLHHLGQAGLLPIRYEQITFSSWQDWQQWRQSVESGCSVCVTSAQAKHQQQSIAFGLHHRQPNFLRWQAQCYLSGTNLMQLPQWVLGDVFETPISSNSPLDWRVPLYLWWRKHPLATARQCQFAWTRIGLPQIKWLPNMVLSDMNVQKRITTRLFQNFFNATHLNRLL
ncbi:MAG TPA: hypothetical protein DCW31_10285 [Lactobacillus sp.]|nr:hypothetical protein [Lactobacillus sp.]